jgi:hypothetical protein
MVLVVVNCLLSWCQPEACRHPQSQASVPAWCCHLAAGTQVLQDSAARCHALYESLVESLLKGLRQAVAWLVACCIISDAQQLSG